MNPQLHRIAHRRQLDNGDFRAGNHSHIQKMLTQGAFSADSFDYSGTAGFQRIQFH